MSERQGSRGRTAGDSSKASRAAGWRLPAGIVLLVVGFLSPLLIPVVAGSGLPPAAKGLLSAFLALGLPEVLMVAAVAVMGKAGFEALKARAFAFLRRHGPPDRVGPVRYRVGLGMFSLPLLYAWASPYLGSHFPALEPWARTLAVAGDLLLVASLFVLGGDFWEKVRALFVREARVVLPAPSPAATPPDADRAR